MAIKIQTQKPVIPIEIGPHNFEFDVSDESIKNLRKEALKAQKEFHSISVNEDDDKALEQAREVLERAYDLFFGKGAFEKIYELSPSIMICMQYFVEIVEGIETELNKRGLSPSAQEKAMKYLAKKK